MHWGPFFALVTSDKFRPNVNLTNFTLLMEKVCDPLFSRKVHSTPDFETLILTNLPTNPGLMTTVAGFENYFIRH